jgi:hypothetical protein
MNDEMTAKNPIHERRKAWRAVIEKHHHEELEQSRDTGRRNQLVGVHAEFCLWEKYINGACEECGPTPDRELE